MKVKIEFEYNEDDVPGPIFEVQTACAQLEQKILNQSRREPGCICTHPEADDVIRDYKGTIIGTIKVTKEDE